MNARRNDPCPCGGGRKYKQCHGRPTRAQSGSGDATWRRLRAELDDFPTRMFRFIKRTFGADAIDEAWDEFTLWEDDGAEFDFGTPHLQVFMPWFFHRWSPDPDETVVEDTSLHDRSPTSVLLERRGRRLDPTLRRYLEGCLAAPFSFFEVESVEPGRGFRARDMLTGEVREVTERSASRIMTAGDAFFGQLVTSGGVTLVEACSAHAIPPGEKLLLIDFREEITGYGPEPTADLLRDWDIEIREIYLELMEAIRNPPTPRHENTSGEPIVFHRLIFDIPSAQEAFDALSSLALGATGSELLESADLDADGHLRRVSFTWTEAGNPVHEYWENTILGQIEIDGRRLVADVNSAARAARLRTMIERRCPDARHVCTEVETVEELLARRDQADEEPEPTDADSLVAHPEVRKRMLEMMMKHYESWLHEAIPALEGLSPMEAVRERNGRERVEALIAQVDRDGRRMSPPLDPSVTRMLRERLGL
jgi:hypothetical protein